MAAPQVGSHLAAHEPFRPASGACRLACEIERAPPFRPRTPHGRPPCEPWAHGMRGRLRALRATRNALSTWRDFEKSLILLSFMPSRVRRACRDPVKNDHQICGCRGSHSGRLRVENVDRPIAGGPRKVGRKALISQMADHSRLKPVHRAFGGRLVAATTAPRISGMLQRLAALRCTVSREQVLWARPLRYG
jgi:hypothetical protein